MGLWQSGPFKRHWRIRNYVRRICAVWKCRPSLWVQLLILSRDHFKWPMWNHGWKSAAQMNKAKIKKVGVAVTHINSEERKREKDRTKKKRKINPRSLVLFFKVLLLYVWWMFSNDP